MTNANVASPISLIQWLDPTDVQRETQDALAAFASEVEIFFADVQIKAEVNEALASWLKNSKYAQYSFVGAHGDERGLAAFSDWRESATWDEVWDWYSQGTLHGGLWLGACKSSHAAMGFSRLLAKGGAVTVPHVYGFCEEVGYHEIRQVLLTLIELTRTSNIIPLCEELAIIRKAVAHPHVELFYPAFTLANTAEYVNVDQMPAKVGMSFHQLLENQGLRARLPRRR